MIKKKFIKKVVMMAILLPVFVLPFYVVQLIGRAFAAISDFIFSRVVEEDLNLFKDIWTRIR